MGDIIASRSVCVIFFFTLCALMNLTGCAVSEDMASQAGIQSYSEEELETVTEFAEAAEGAACGEASCLVESEDEAEIESTNEKKEKRVKLVIQILNG